MKICLKHQSLEKFFPGNAIQTATIKLVVDQVVFETPFTNNSQVFFAPYIVAVNFLAAAVGQVQVI
jgi:hypothetical protein